MDPLTWALLCVLGLVAYRFVTRDGTPTAWWPFIPYPPTDLRSRKHDARSNPDAPAVCLSRHLHG